MGLLGLGAGRLGGPRGRAGRLSHLLFYGAARVPCAYFGRAGACYSLDMSRKTFEDFDLNREQALLRKKVDAYPGDEFWAEYLRDDYDSLEEATKIAQNPGFVESTLISFGLEGVLADKHSSAGLRQLLLSRDPRTIKWLAAYVKGLKSPRRKPGPKPKADGEYLKESILKLHDAGLTNGAIAKLKYGDARKANRVAAHLAQARRPKR